MKKTSTIADAVAILERLAPAEVEKRLLAIRAEGGTVAKQQVRLVETHFDFFPFSYQGSKESKESKDAKDVE